MPKSPTRGDFFQSKSTITLNTKQTGEPLSTNDKQESAALTT